MINYHTFSISFIPTISLFFIFLKNLTHPLYSKYLSPFFKRDSIIPLLLGYLDPEDRILLEKLIGKGG